MTATVRVDIARPKTFSEIAIWLGARQVELFESDSPVYIGAFCHNSAMRKIVCDYYNILVIEKMVIAIENLEPEFKKALKETAIDMADGRLDTNGCVQLCKYLQVLSYHKTI